LLAARLEGHRRGIEARADIDPPKLVERAVVIGDQRAVGVAGDDEAAGGGGCDPGSL
jgi:hypothetical protein